MAALHNFQATFHLFFLDVYTIGMKRLQTDVLGDFFSWCTREFGQDGSLDSKFSARDGSHVSLPIFESKISVNNFFSGVPITNHGIKVFEMQQIYKSIRAQLRSATAEPNMFLFPFWATLI